MQIQVNVKQLGKKHPVIALQTIEIADLPEKPCLRDLLTAVVNQQVAVYNDKVGEAESFMPLLVTKQVESQGHFGKIGFDQLYNKNTADLGKAIDTAIQAFEDGLFCVFIDEQQIEALNDNIVIAENSVLSFVRLTFLSGSFW